MAWKCGNADAVSYTHLRAHETVLDLVCRLLLEKKKEEKEKEKKKNITRGEDKRFRDDGEQTAVNKTER